MATDKLFNVVGVSKLGVEYKVRFANDIMRVKVLDKHGHEDIRLAELATAVTKIEAVRQIQSMPEFADVDAQSAIADYLSEKAPAVKAPKAVKTPQVPAIAGMTPLGIAPSTMETREAEALRQAAAVALEDANVPF
jgi:hypothetical protein